MVLGMAFSLPSHPKTLPCMAQVSAALFRGEPATLIQDLSQSEDLGTLEPHHGGVLYDF